jgi:hypothetical protein
MLEEFKGVGGFWRGVFSENDGTPSSTRIFTGLAVAFSLGWVTHLVSKNNALPDFMGLCLFIGTLYGLNAGKNAFSDYLNSKK